MTVYNDENKVRYQGNGITLDFDFDFKIFAANDLEIYLVDPNNPSDAILQQLGLDYSVYISNVNEGGTVTFITTPPPMGKDILMIRIEDYTQETQIPEESVFPERALENSLDKLTMLVQQLEEQSVRSIKFVKASENSDKTMPEPETGKALKWDKYGNLVNSTVNIEDIDSAVEGAEAAAAAAAASAAAAQNAEAAAETAQGLAEDARDDAIAAVGTVKVTSNDTTSGVLNNKISVVGELSSQILNPGANEILQLSFNTVGRLKSPPITIFASQFYTPSPGVKDVLVDLIGGGGGTGNTPNSGGATSFAGYCSATGGTGGAIGVVGSAGVGISGNILNASGSDGSEGLWISGAYYVGLGGGSPLSGSAKAGSAGKFPGGGAAGYNTGNAASPHGSAGGGRCISYISNIGNSPIFVTIGLGATNTLSGANGICTIYEYY